MSHEVVNAILAIGIFLLASILMGLYIYFEVKKGRRAPQISRDEWDLMVKKMAEMLVWQEQAYNVLAPMQKWHYDNNTGFKEIQDAFRNQVKSGNGGKGDHRINE